MDNMVYYSIDSSSSIIIFFSEANKLLLYS